MSTPLDSADTTSLPRDGLSSPERIRYSRHLQLHAIGETGQLRLKQSRVLIVGVGGLGSPAALYLAAAGVGNLGLVDADRVDVSNLHRQVLYGEDDIGQWKVEAAARALRRANPHVNIHSHVQRLDASNALALISAYDLVIDGTDNFPTRYILNDACALAGKPYVYGSIHHFEGQAAVFDARRGPCYRCLFPTPPQPGVIPACAEAGVLGILPGIIGMIQATEAIKLILGLGDTLIGRVLTYDALSMSFQALRLQKDLECALCGRHPRIKQVEEMAYTCAGDAQPPIHDCAETNAAELRALLESRAMLTLIDVREPHETTTGTIPGARFIPLSQFEERIHEIGPDSEVILYCAAGVRSRRAATILARAGFLRVRSLAGGYNAWNAFSPGSSDHR